jgi:hypothetical protein
MTDDGAQDTSATDKATQHQQGSPDPLMSDGKVRFRVRRSGGAETVHEVDLLVLKVTCEQCEDQHQLTIKDGRIQPTADFLIDLAGRLTAYGLADCTPTLAWQAWIAATEAMASLKNAMSETPS